MIFEGLADRLQETFKKLRGHGKLTEDDVKSDMKEVRMALLEADVNFKVVKDFVKRVTERAIGQDVMEALTPAQVVIKIVNEELTELMGGSQSKINMSSQPPTIIMMAGLQGAGKTTSAGKLGLALKKQGKRPVLVAADIYRPAAVTQLQVIGKQLNIPVFSMEPGTDAVTIAKSSLNYAFTHANDVVIIDTAGRLHNKINLMNELTKIKNVMRKVIPDAPHEILLVLDGSTGQNAFEQAKQFTAATEVNALAVTKLDGTAKGGVVIGISDHFHIPVKYIGLGEGMEDLQVFRKREFVNSLFGE